MQPLQFGSTALGPFEIDNILIHFFMLFQTAALTKQCR